MKKALIISSIVVFVLTMAFCVFCLLQKYDRIYNPTKSMTAQETIEFYFDIKIPNKKMIKKEYIRNGCVAFKIDISTLNDSELTKLTQGYEEYKYEEYDWEEGGNPFDDVDGVNWWHLNRSIVDKSFTKLDSPKRDIGAKTAVYTLFFVYEDSKNYLYMLYTD